jgi:hypothetical protein
MNVQAIVTILVALIGSLGPAISHSTSASTSHLVADVCGGIIAVAAAVKALYLPQPGAVSRSVCAKCAVTLSALALVVVLSGCSWLKAEAPVIEKDVAGIGACEAVYVVTDPAPTPIGMVKACAGLVLADAEAMFGKLAVKLQADGGAPSPLAAKLAAAKAH